MILQALLTLYCVTDVLRKEGVLVPTPIAALHTLHKCLLYSRNHPIHSFGLKSFTCNNSSKARQMGVTQDSQPISKKRAELP